MISTLRRKSLSLLHPVLKRLAGLYLSKPRNYKHKGISIKVLPGVFHPGLFFSTKIFIEFLETIELKGKKVLELGAGSGLISLYCAKQLAKVTASDINPTALEGLKQNATQNGESINVISSDLFDHISVHEFDIILINPPYYPQKPKTLEETAWFCGSDFEYFKKLFCQLGEASDHIFTVFMILSEDCDIARIEEIAKKHEFQCKEVYFKRVRMEKNYIYEFSSI